MRAAAPIVRVHTAASIVVLDLRFFFLLSITLILAWGCVLIIHFLVTAHEITNVVGRRVSADDPIMIYVFHINTYDNENGWFPPSNSSGKIYVNARGWTSYTQGSNLHMTKQRTLPAVP